MECAPEAYFRAIDMIRSPFTIHLIPIEPLGILARSALNADQIVAARWVRAFTVCASASEASINSGTGHGPLEIRLKMRAEAGARCKAGISPSALLWAPAERQTIREFLGACGKCNTVSEPYTR